jgi:dihydroorotase
MRYDLLLKNAETVDPKSGRRAVMDLAIHKSHIAAIAQQIDDSLSHRSVDLTGRIVTPGLVDAHAHIYYNSCDMGAHTDEFCAPSGVTTVCDGGSTGALTFPGFRELVERAVRTRCRAFVHLSVMGITACEVVGELLNSKYADPDACARTIVENRDLAVGVKLRLGHDLIWNPREALRLARQAADGAEVPLMVHITDSPIPLPEVLEYLKPGDIVSHCFHGFPHGIFKADRSLIQEPIWEAQKRGILFDSAHGRNGHFSFPLVRRALELGFLPDMITTDLGLPSAIRGPVFDMTTTMSKFLNLGMSLDDIILRTTLKPAAAIGLAESLGHLSVGAVADVAVFELHEGRFEFIDTDKSVITGTRRIRAVMTIRGGRIVYEAGEPTGSPSLERRRLLT